MKRVFVVLGFMLFVLYACGGDSDPIVNEVLIQFESGGGSAVDDLLVDLENPPSALEEPVREGYDFAGWYLDDDFMEAFDFNTLEAVESVTLYARWTEVVDTVEDPDVFTVSFDYLDGTDLVQVDVEEGATVDEPSLREREGFVFDGWFENAMFEDEFDFDAPIEAHTSVYAKWLEIFTIRFYAEGDLLVETEVLQGETVELPTAPDKTGYSFDGWYIGDFFTESFIFDETDPIMNHLDIHASYVQNTYTITFESGEYTVEPMEFLFDTSVTLPVIEEADHFIGWYLEDTFETRFFGVELPPNDLTLYAWFGTTYTVTYYVDDTVFYDQSYVDGDSLSFPENEPEKTGHDFIGWRRFMGDFEFPNMAIEGGSVTFHLDFRAAFEPSLFVIDYGEDTVEVPYGEPIELSNTNPRFVGWYLDDTFETPLDYETMPAYDITVYPRIADENDVLDIETLYMYGLTSARLEADVIHVEYADINGVYLYVLNDGTGNLLVMLQEELSETVLDKTVDIHVELIFDEVLFGVDVTSFSVIGNAEPRDKVHIDDATLGTLDFTKGEHQSAIYTINAFIMREGSYVTVFDMANAMSHPIVNMQLSTAYDAALDALEHHYVTFAFVVFPGEYGLNLIYLEDYRALDIVSMSDATKVDTLADLLELIFDTQTFHVGEGLEFPETDPFFGASMSAEVTGDNAAYYYDANDVFLFTEDTLYIDVEVTLSLGGETSTFITQIRLEGLTPDAFEDVTDVGIYTLRGTVIHEEGPNVLFGDQDHQIWLSLSGETLEIGNEYVLEVSVISDGRILNGILDRKVVKVSEEPLTVGVPAMTIKNLHQIESSLSLFRTFEGVILSSDHIGYPYILSNGTEFIYLPDHPSIEGALGERVSIELFIIGEVTWGETGFIGHFADGFHVLDILPFMTFDQMMFSEKLLEAYFEDVYRPERGYDFPLAFDDLGHSITYTFSGGSSTDIMMQSNAMKTITFLEEGTYTFIIEIDVDGFTYQITKNFTVEDYTFTSIEDALSDGEDLRYTFMLMVDGMSREYSTILTDGTGVVKLAESMIDAYLPHGDTVIITASLIEQDGFVWLSDVTFEETTSETVTPTTAELMTFEALQALDEAYEGLLHIEIEGVIAFPPSGMDMSLVHTDDSFIMLGRDPSEGEWFNHIGVTVTIRGYFMYSIDFDQNIIAIAEVLSSQD